MKDIDSELNAETPYECFGCGKIVFAETTPSQCPDCNKPMRNRHVPLE